MNKEANKIFVGGVYWDAEKIEEMIRNHTNQNVEAVKSLRESLVLIQKLEAENKKLREYISHFGLSQKVDEFHNELKTKKENGCCCPPKKNDGSVFDGVSYVCNLHGR